MDASGAHLRFVEVDRLRALGEGQLNNAIVRGAADAVLGTLTGALIDPLQRRVCFLIVESDRWFARHQYALPLDAARIDRTRHELVMDGGGDALHEVHVEGFARFSDQDVVDAMFPPHAS